MANLLIALFLATVVPSFIARRFWFQLSYGHTYRGAGYGKSKRVLTWSLHLNFYVTNPNGTKRISCIQVGRWVKGGDSKHLYNPKPWLVALTGVSCWYPDDSNWTTVYFSAHPAEYQVDYGMSH